MDVPLPVPSISALLTRARHEKTRVALSWFPVSGFAGEGPVTEAELYMTVRWDHIIRTLEALESATHVSRMLYGDCVELPSRDERHLFDPVVLHSLLMQQLGSLATRLGPRHNVMGTVPLAVREVEMEEEVKPAPLRAPPEALGPPEDGLQEEEQGSTCTIT